jgi:RNA polymerase sigma-70 factor (ECF subfamily)
MIRNGCEAQTLQHAIDGDEMSQRTIYERHHGAASRLAYLLLGNAMDAEEVVQDAFVYAFRNLDRYDPERAAFWTWLRVIVVSRCRNKRRRKQLPRVSLEVLSVIGQAPAASGPSSDPADALERWDTRREIYAALEKVSSGARDALVLRYYEGLAYAEIAEILGCSDDAARSRVVHGKSQLRRLLAAREEQPMGDHGAVRPAEV